jgi:hypothetical protein
MDVVPELVGVVSPRARKNHQVASALEDHAWVREITRALTVPMLIKYLEPRQCLEGVAVQEGVKN